MVSNSETFDEPSDVQALDGEVTVNGPDAVDVKFTPEAAEETSDRLIKEAARAAGQRRLKDMPHRPDE